MLEKNSLPSAGTVGLITADVINSLPENLRWYVMELETMADPSGMIRRNMQLEHDNQALQVMIVALQKNSLFCPQ